MPYRRHELFNALTTVHTAHNLSKTPNQIESISQDVSQTIKKAVLLLNLNTRAWTPVNLAVDRSMTIVKLWTHGKERSQAWQHRRSYPQLQSFIWKMRDNDPRIPFCSSRTIAERSRDWMHRCRSRTFPWRLMPRPWRAIAEFYRWMRCRKSHI